MKLERLEKLCRALQSERNELNKKIEGLQDQVSNGDGTIDGELLETPSVESSEEKIVITSKESGIQPIPEPPLPDRPILLQETGPLSGIDSVD